MNKLYLFAMFILIMSCATNIKTDAQISSKSGAKVNISIPAEDAEECNSYRSWQLDYWKDKNYRRCIYCNMYMMELKCDLSEDPINYYNLSRSFIEISPEKADSAFWALNIGMEENGETEVLLELGAYISKKNNNISDQIYYLENVMELYPSNQRVLEQLSTIFSQQERYEEQVEVLDIWLGFDRCSANVAVISESSSDIEEDNVCISDKKYKKAIGEKKRAYQYQGLETSEVDLERWESDKSNLQYGLYYLKALKEQEDWYEIISYADEMLFYDTNNVNILEAKAEAQETEFEYLEAISTYEKLYDITNEYRYAINISKILVEDANFKEAYKWAKEAVVSTESNPGEQGKGEAVFQRAEVLFYLGRSCQDQNINFWDKIVYEIALKDYKKAYDLKNYNAQLRVNELEKDSYYITTPTDWALNASGVGEVCPSCINEKVDVKLKDCYSFINVRIKKQ